MDVKKKNQSYYMVDLNDFDYYWCLKQFKKQSLCVSRILLGTQTPSSIVVLKSLLGNNVYLLFLNKSSINYGNLNQILYVIYM